MQALILAAGMGSRLKQYTKENTKCMIKLNGRMLIDRTIENLLRNNINKIIVVVGYKGNKLIKYLSDNYSDIDFTFVKNGKYMETNNIYSLYLARQYLEQDDTILMESDIIFEDIIMDKLINDNDKDVAVVAKYSHWMDGTVVSLDNENNVISFTDKVDFNFFNTNNYYKTVNIYKLSKTFINNYYLNFLEAYIKSFGHNDYYESVLKVVAGFKDINLKGLDVSDYKWYEIDDSQDLDIASIIFSDKDKILENFERRYGGYWRFDNVLDFCYLVNPHFPNEKFYNKINYMTKILSSSYPSSLSTQSFLASKLFDIDASNIIVGNGAAELINCLKVVLYGTLGVFVPTFNEYIRCFSNLNIYQINTINNDFKVNKNMIYSVFNKIDSLILINPDNPSGNLISYDDIIEIIEKFNAAKKYIVIDESFIDFASFNLRYTLLSNEILNKYPYLIVVKSISKSYGVPGIRLGILANSNEKVTKAIIKEMPVWNINSFGEYFFQVIGFFKKEYLFSCDRISEEREWLKKELNKFNNITVYDSQANYIMCRIKGIDCYTLCTNLLYEHNIYLKRLDIKNGFDGKQYIRIAVRTREDNERLLDCLKEYL